MIYYSLKEIKNFLSSDCKETYLLTDFTFEDALEEFNGIIQKDFSFAKTLIETFDFTGAKKKLLENFENIRDITEQGKENLKMFNEHKTKYKDKFKERKFTINKEYRDAFFSIFKNKDYIDHLLLVSEKLKEGEYQEIEYVNLYANIIKFENQISEILKTQCYPNAIKNENVLNQFTLSESVTDFEESEQSENNRTLHSILILLDNLGFFKLPQVESLGENKKGELIAFLTKYKKSNCQVSIKEMSTSPSAKGRNNPFNTKKAITDANDFLTKLNS